MPRGPYEEIVQDYAQKYLESPKFDLNAVPEFVSMICSDGRLATVLDGHKLQWHRGLVSLCSPEVDGQVGAAADLHFEANNNLYRRWHAVDDNYGPRCASSTSTKTQNSES